MKKGTYEDKIRIEELEVYAHHGVYPEENEKGQHFYVNATLYTNTRPAGLADDLSLSTNYGEVCQFITEFMQQHTFQLIETVAERTAYEVLQHFPLVQGLDLEIRKPEAPIPLPFGSVSVAIHREWHILPLVPIWETAESISRRLWDSFRRTKTSEWKRCRSCWRHYLMAS